MVQQLCTNTFTTAKWIVSHTASDGTHTTIQAAINSASAGDVIFIRPGTYTENITMSSNVSLAAYTGDGIQGAVVINGKVSFSATGQVSITGIELLTNSDNFLSLTGANISVVYLIDCYLNCLNNTGISSTGSNAAATINIINCLGNIATTGITLFTVSNGLINFEYTHITNTGASTTTSTISSAAHLETLYSRLNFPITSSNTAEVDLLYSLFDTSTQSTTPSFTFNSTTNADVHNCIFSAGAIAAVSLGAGSIVGADQLFFSSSATNAVAGSGTLAYAMISFGQSQEIAATIIQNPESVYLGKLRMPLQPCFFVNLVTSLTNKTGAGASYNVLFDTTTFDQASNITLNSAGRTIFTAPVTGKYLFEAAVTFSGLTAAMTQSQIQIIATGMTIVGPQANIGAIRDVGNLATSNASAIIAMTKNDTALLNVSISNGAGNTAGLLGSSSATASYTRWCGYLIG